MPDATPDPCRVEAGYARRLLESLGVAPAALAEPTPPRHPARAWADSGLMQITGLANGAPQMCPLPLAAQADGVLLALRALAPDARVSEFSGAALLGERANIMGLRRNGAASPGGHCRLLQAADCGLAINLARDEDWDLLGAWLEDGPVGDWAALADAVVNKPVEALVARGRLMGLALCANAPPRTQPVPWFRVDTLGEPAQADAKKPPLVVDISSLWAGPLCGRLLARLGAEVIKVESAHRPDGARLGPPEFFERMHAGKQMLRLDFRRARDLGRLRELLGRADIVIEASRPRALLQLGIDARALVRERAGLTWISITGYGRQPPAADWVAFGDDAGVAAGLSWIMRIATGENLICGDAIADPLTGLHAALAAWASYRNGGGRLIDLSMRDVVTHAIQYDLPESDDALRTRHRAWSALVKQQQRAQQ